MKRLLHGTLQLRNSPAGEQIQNGRTTDEISRDPRPPCCVHNCYVLAFSLENFIIFLYEIKLLFTLLTYVNVNNEAR